MNDAVATAPTERRFASRKFTIAVLASAFLYLGRLTGAEWPSACTWIVGLYMAGNVGSAAAGQVSIQVQR